MIRSQSRVTVNRPAEDVFRFLADGTNNPKWRSGVLEISKVSGEGVGAVYKQVLRGPGGRPVAGDYRVTEFQPPNRLAFAVIAGPARPIGTFTVRSEDALKSTVTFSLEVRPKGAMFFMSPMIARQVRREVEAIGQLKRVLEAT
jgi:uncharacterized protein YndB with AHSA1/START domain